MTPAQITRPLLQINRTDPCFCGSGQRFKSCCGTLARPRKPPAGVECIASFVDEKTCRQWTEYLEQQPRTPLAVHELDDTEPSRLSRQETSGRVTDKVKHGDLREQIVSLVKRAYTTIIPETLGREIEWFENPQVLRYEPGGLYGPHSDSDHYIAAESQWRKVIDRDVSLLIYLNEDFDGGELSFRQFNYRYKPCTGDLLFFPSHGHYAHQALPTTRGIRYVIVSWAAFRDEPRVSQMRPSDSIYL